MENEKHKEKLINQIEETIECLKDFKEQITTFPICFYHLLFILQQLHIILEK